MANQSSMAGMNLNWPNPNPGPGMPVSSGSPIGIFPNVSSGYSNQGFAGQLDTSVNAQVPTAGHSGEGAGFLRSLLGGTDENGIQSNGWGGLALGAAQGLLGGYMGMKQYGLAKDQLAESKRQFNANFDTNRKLTNSRLRDRQRARVASNPKAYQSVGAYMNKNGV